MRFFSAILLSLVFLGFLLTGCLGTDSEETSIAKEAASLAEVDNCSDGVDQDGDGQYDCYDPDCRLLDSILVADGQAGICERNVNWRRTVVSSSSAEGSSSSEGVSSSDVSSSAVGGFPLEFDGVDLIQSNASALAYNSSGNTIGVAGAGEDGVVFILLDATTGNMLGQRDYLMSNTDDFADNETAYGTWQDGSVVSTLRYGQFNGSEYFYTSGYSLWGDNSNPYPELIQFPADAEDLLSSVPSRMLKVIGEYLDNFFTSAGDYFALYTAEDNTSSVLYGASGSENFSQVSPLSAGGRYTSLTNLGDTAVVAVGYQLINSDSTRMKITKISALTGGRVYLSDLASSGAKEYARAIIKDTTDLIVGFESDGTPGLLRAGANGAVLADTLLLHDGSLRRVIQLDDQDFAVLTTRSADSMVALTRVARDLSSVASSVEVGSGSAGDIVQTTDGTIIVSGYSSAGIGWVRTITLP